MKHYYSILLFATVAAFSSCSKVSQQADVLPAGQMTIKAGFEDVKTYYQSGNVIWAKDDAINVFAGTSNEKFILEGNGGATSGNFTGNQVSGDIYALYPYDANASFSDGVITATVKASQNVNANGFGNNTNVAVAHYEDGEMTFANLCGLVRIDVKGNNIGEIVISGNNDEDIAGTVNVTWNNGNPQYTVVDGKKQISLKTHNGKVITRGAYYAVVLPQVFEKGITITMKPYTFTTDEVVKRVFKPAEIQKSGTNSLSLQRAHVKPLGVIDANQVWDYSGTVTLGALRSPAGKVKDDSGIYIDFSNGRTFYPIGAYAYCADIDAIMIKNDKNGIGPCSVSAQNPQMFNAFLPLWGTPAAEDYPSTWATKNGPKFAYVAATELSDKEHTDEERYAALSTVNDIKAIFDAHSAVNCLYKQSDEASCITNANRLTTNKYVVFKTYTNSEGSGYGILKATGIGGNPWYIQFVYKWGLEATQ